MLPIIIITPPYNNNSNGIKSLHRIAHTINQIGGDARLLFLIGGIIFGGKKYTNLNWNTPCLGQDEGDLIKTGIVVYPEIVSGNPLGASKVVRYMGNKESLLNGKTMGAGAGDFILAHSKVIRPDADYVLFSAFYDVAFNNDGTELPQYREFDATYVGKGNLYGKTYTRKDTFLISRNWPQGADQLAYLLRRTRYFYTWDSWTQTNVDAVLCGAVPFFLRYDPWTEAELDGSELGIIPRLDEKNHEFYPLVFQENRRKLIENIDRLNASWDSRVRKFWDKTQFHFFV